ncbi:MAG: hypothetical protein ACOC7T_03065 [Planctomycetota bacterium]
MQPPVLAPSELKRGMTGYGITDLGRGKPERFEIEVLGVLRGWDPKGDLIMIRMSGPVIDQAGGFSGMSGSPVYVDKKLIGAVAYGWPFAKVPLAGVTPVTEMMKVTKLAEEPEPGQRAGRADRWRRLQRRLSGVADLFEPGEGRQPDPRTIRQTVVRAALPRNLASLQDRSVPLPQAVAAQLPHGADDRLQPLPIPLAVGGMTGTANPLSDALGGTAFLPLQAGVGGGEPAEDEAPELVPGTPVGPVFVTGDMSIAGMGTLTWQRDGKLLAFGHPMLGAGRVNLPLAVGREAIVVPSLYNSFRMTNAGRIIGSITQDRDSAIFGELGRHAPMFPCTVRVSGIAADEYNYQVAGYWQTAPLFAALAVQASSERWQGSGNPYHIRASTRISLEGRQEPITLNNHYADFSVLGPSLEQVLLPLSQLTMNPFREVEIEQLDFELSVERGLQAAQIISLTSNRPQAEPGSAVALTVGLRKWRGDRTTKQVEVQIPENAEPGTQIQILVADAASNRMVERRFDPGFYNPDTFQGLVRMLQRMESNRNLVVRVSFLEQGLRFQGDAMPALPPSAVNILRFNRADGRAQPLTRDLRFSVETPWVLSGSQMITLAIKQSEPHGP